MKGLNLSLNGRLWLFFSIVMLVVAYFGWTFYSEKWLAYSTESQALDQSILTQRGKLRQILAQKQRIKDLEAEIETAEAEFAHLKEMFPDEEAIPKRLLDLTAVTRRSLTLPTKFAPLATEEKDFYRENHYAVTINSSYHSLGMLFGEVANFKYPTSISKVQIEKVEDLEKEVEESKNHGETPRTLTASFQLTTFTSKR